MENIEKSYGNNCLGFVVRIISETALIIDVGEDTLTIGDYIQVYNASDEIKDLNGNPLGVFEDVKETLEVTYTSTDYSVCQKISETIESPLNPLGGALAPKTIRKAERINVDKNDIRKLKLEDNVIRVGDPVKMR